MSVVFGDGIMFIDFFVYIEECNFSFCRMVESVFKVFLFVMFIFNFCNK